MSSGNPFGQSSSSGPPFGSPLGPSSGAPGQPFAVARPPSGLLIAAAGVALVGLVIAIVGVFREDAVALVGWALAGPLAIILLGFFVAADTRRQAEPVYTRPGWVGLVYAIAAVLIVAGIVVASVGVALWIGRL
ncbi:hypothetical protein GOEFS_096_00750 [Gordonia effusa NBRC 100432]|uniref:Uncharacterized protein n=1 Tax=Gordonia effusa NBRC 100432 TaxID=1077974 RepID=H0R497_9ACTN|nr:hypothetical protein [Gordonia effusa]GAB19898.1 hypothetical protein GOEFS_096_00750 [Gordonia effusa NBRC 100432]